jgi:3',5'-cyclic AMP phosphodiesterase CpdA
MMRIVHVSDLHFGKHNVSLAEDLTRRVAQIQPDLIIASGDIVDHPEQNLFEEAHRYLIKLTEGIKPAPPEDPKRPKLITIPGNHDFLAKGWLPRFIGELGWETTNYYKHFAGCQTEHFFQPENVWVFGFDSARKGNYSGGEIPDADLELFHKRYDSLKGEFGALFVNAFKIAVVHHHPLPVNWDTDWRQRWLTMLNAGTFLAAVLYRHVDLVIHGHEHLQANARLSSTLGGKASEDFETSVVSLGATLRAVTNPNRNWFNLITISNHMEVSVESFPSAGEFVFENAGVLHTIRSPAEAQQVQFDQIKLDAGYVFSNMTSITSVDGDGDARRAVECELRILKPGVPQARQQVVHIPYTSGDIQLLEVTSDGPSGVAGISFKDEPSNGHLIERRHVWERTIDFGKTIPQGVPVDYLYRWWAVDAFAMDERQFGYTYPDNRTYLEFTHMVIGAPVEEFMIVVQFPRDFPLPPSPEIRVSIPDSSVGAHEWKRVSAVEDQLNDAKALRYLKSLTTAALRITRPKAGYSYGIQWRVPASPKNKESHHNRQISEIVRLLLRKAASDTAMLLPLLYRLAKTTRAIFLKSIDSAGHEDEWKKPIEVSLTIFDAPAGKLVMISAADFVKHDDEKLSELDFSGITFSYGDGIAGKAFKTNEPRLYVRQPERRRTPNHYRRLPNQKEHWALLCLPIRSPDDSNNVYGVVSLGSDQPDCPLARIGEPTFIVGLKDIAAFNMETDRWIFHALGEEKLLTD